jgi:hypothetical protein
MRVYSAPAVKATSTESFQLDHARPAPQNALRQKAGHFIQAFGASHLARR